MGQATRLQAGRDRMIRAALDIHDAAGSTDWLPAQQRFEEALEDFEGSVREAALSDAVAAVEAVE